MAYLSIIEIVLYRATMVKNIERNKRSSRLIFPTLKFEIPDIPEKLMELHLDYFSLTFDGLTIPLILGMIIDNWTNYKILRKVN